MAKVNLPGPHGVLAERDGRTSRAFYDWFRRIQEQIDAGELSADEALTLIAEMATKLGSPDGTVENIPENVIRAGDGIVVFPNGDLRQNDVFIGLDPNVEPEPPLPLGAYMTLGDALEGEPGPCGPQGPAGPPGRDGATLALLFDFDQGEPVAFSPQVNLAYAYGNLPVGNLNSGTNASSATFWRGDGTWSNQLNGNFELTGTGRKFLADFSNATVANRAVLQTSTTNGNTVIGTIPNGTATTTAHRIFNGSDQANAGFFGFRIDTTQAYLESSSFGTGTTLRMGLYVGGAERVGIETNGNVGVATTSFGGGAGVIGVLNAITVPISNPTGGAIWYVEGGASKARGSSGTTTTFAAANPHCPECGSDFVHEWDNPEKWGYLAVCMNCHADGKNSHTRTRGAWNIED